MAMFQFVISNKFKEAADKAAADRNVSASQLVREALAAYIGYDLQREAEARIRRNQYATREERKAARKERNRVKREEEKELLQALRQGLKKADMDALRASIRNKKGTK